MSSESRRTGFRQDLSKFVLVDDCNCWKIRTSVGVVCWKCISQPARIDQRRNGNGDLLADSAIQRIVDVGDRLGERARAVAAVDLGQSIAMVPDIGLALAGSLVDAAGGVAFAVVGEAVLGVFQQTVVAADDFAIGVDPVASLVVDVDAVEGQLGGRADLLAMIEPREPLVVVLLHSDSLACHVIAAD